MKRFRSIQGVLAVLLCLGFVMMGMALPGRVSAAKKIVFGFDWVPYGKYVGYYAAREKGFYLSLIHI